MKKRKGKKKFAWNLENRVLNNMMASIPGVIVINLLFQGMLGMDKSELIFHFLFDLILIVTSPFLFHEYNQNILSKKEMSSARFSILGFWRGNFQTKFRKKLGSKGDKKSRKGRKLKEREYLNYLAFGETRI